MSEEIEIQPELIQHYPWLPSLKNAYSTISSLDPIIFINKIFKTEKNQIKNRLLKLFNAAFNNIEYLTEYIPDQINIHLYIILKILLYALDNNTITNRIANIYSKTNYEELMKENDYNLYAITRDLNNDILYYQEPIKYKVNIVKDQKEILSTNFRIHYTNYLSLSSSLRDDYRRLVNNPISDGYVFISRINLIRLLQEYIRNKILEIKSTDHDKIEKTRNQLLQIDGFREIYDNILAQWEVKKEEFEYSIDIQYKQGENLSNVFPPCIKEILSKAKEGENLEHTERLYLVFFLHALDYPLEEVINVFSSLPDFDREKTAYQVEFAKKKGYTPHSCDTLKSLKLCMAKKYKDQLCLEGYYSKKLDEHRKIKHPLFYVQFNKYKNLKTNENLAEGEGS